MVGGPAREQGWLLDFDWRHDFSYRHGSSFGQVPGGRQCDGGLPHPICDLRFRLSHGIRAKPSVCTEVRTDTLGSVNGFGDRRSEKEWILYLNKALLRHFPIF